MQASASPLPPLAPRWQRLHAWTGAVPLAGFLVVHLLAQAPVLWGPLAYAGTVGRLPSPWPTLLEVAQRMGTVKSTYDPKRTVR